MATAVIATLVIVPIALLVVDLFRGEGRAARKRPSHNAPHRG